ncbi:hypothetical protein DOY81_006637 [Sarcophaga bullata]|nr:hypothetical protein DOY81_006637 [Sarcophaga bullata]
MCECLVCVILKSKQTLFMPPLWSAVIRKQQQQQHQRQQQQQKQQQQQQQQQRWSQVLQ